MYLSQLMVDIGNNPDRPRPGRLWLRNIYRVHQRLCMGFPSYLQKESDEYFIKQYNPEEFIKHVNVQRSENNGFLFRVETRFGGSSPVILVLSAIEPNWEYAFQNAEYLLACEPQCKVFQPTFVKDQKFLFRLRANPTRKETKIEDGIKVKKNWGIIDDSELKKWIIRKGELGGFSVDLDSITVFKGQDTSICFGKHGNMKDCNENKDDSKSKPLAKFRGASFEGNLNIENPEKFIKTIQSGVGRGKAFGFGLLTVARL